MPSAGRDPRIAVLVHNDAANDSRVLKESASLAALGADVRIIAVERRLRGRGAGLERLAPRIQLERVPEFALERLAPGLARRVRRSPSALGRPSETPAADAAETAAPPPAKPSALVSRARGVAQKAAGDLSQRAYRTIELGTWWWRAARAGGAFDPDIVHANDTNALVPALAIQALGRLRGRDVKLVLDAHELWRHRNVPGRRVLAPALEALIEHIGIPAADAVMTVSPSIAAWLQKTYRLDETPLVVRNVPAAGALPDRSTGVLRQRAGLDSAARVIAYGGRLTTSRGIEETIAALPHLAPDVHLVLLGYGEDEYTAQIERLAASLGVADRVHLVGAVAPAEVSAALADGDVAVVHVQPICLSYEYALPNKLFESIRAGLPIAAADLPDMSAVVRELGVGEVFEGSDPAELAEALQRILSVPQAYRDSALAAAPRLTWENEARPMLDAYRRLLEEVRPR